MFVVTKVTDVVAGVGDSPHTGQEATTHHGWFLIAQIRLLPLELLGAICDFDFNQMCRRDKYQYLSDPYHRNLICFHEDKLPILLRRNASAMVQKYSSHFL